MSSGNATAASARSPQRQRGRDRVAGLMAAAAVLFSEKGYDGTTMTEIAARAGAAIGSLYLFFPTKAALAQAMAMELADALSTRLDVLRQETANRSGPEIADALFGELARFLASHPVYAVLVELPGDEGWKQAVRVRRRAQIEALFAQAWPKLPPGQPERLALIVPQLMSIPLRSSGLTGPGREAVLAELQRMLRSHLEASTPR